jgi:hypothetical protein
MTSHHTSRRRQWMMSGAMLVTASLSGLVGVAAPANAAPDAFVAVAIGDVNDAPPVQTVGGVATAPGGDQAAQDALTDCVHNGGHQCVVRVITKNSCAAIASNDFGEFSDGEDISLRRAREEATGNLQNKQGAHLVVSGCSNGQGQLPPAPAPAPPKLGPTVSFYPILGGLEADVTDRSGVASQCTYAMENVNRSFGLAANAAFELKIVPLIPKLRDQSVTISCDNGTKTQATTHF